MEKRDDLRIEKMVKFLTGEMSREEQQEFSAELINDKTFKAEFIRLKKFWNQEELKSDILLTMKYWYRFKQEITPNENRTPKYKSIGIWVAAASIALLLVSSILFVRYQPLRNLKSQMNYLIDTLPDGSLVYLSPNSTLKYKPVKRFVNKMEMTVVGQAFFVLKRQSRFEYIINAGDTRAKIVGTVFSIYAMPNEQEVKVIVEAGEVQLTSDTGDNGLLVEAGEEAVFNSRLKTMKKQPKTSDIYIVYQPQQNR